MVIWSHTSLMDHVIADDLEWPLKVISATVSFFTADTVYNATFDDWKSRMETVQDGDSYCEIPVECHTVIHDPHLWTMVGWQPWTWYAGVLATSGVTSTLAWCARCVVCQLPASPLHFALTGDARAGCRLCLYSPVARQPPFDWYQVILLGDRGTQV